MKKRPINYSWPATLSDFSTDEKQGNFSRGKLKVFFKGETADHRYFSDEFSEELVKTLPYTPVVSHYDADADDFVGHATEQEIYGMVDPCVEPSFVTDEEGKEWAVCDVVLYTERPDMVGKIAQKIVGHKQSLELDPKTVKYTINYDNRRHFKNLEFTAGKFIGVSVLGEDQRPAFTGSEFFAVNADFEEKMALIKDYCEGKIDQQTGGDPMNLQEFMKLSWGDISSKVDSALTQEYGAEACTYIVDMFEDSAIVRWYSYIDGTVKLMRVKYSLDDNAEITLGDVNEVHVVYEDLEQTAEEETGVEQVTETSMTEEATNAAVEPEPVAEPVSDLAEEQVENKVDQAAENATEPEEVKTVTDAACSTENVENTAQVPNAEVTQATEKVSEIDESQPEQQEKGAGSASFAESERAELEALKREKKINLLDSYKETLSEEEYADFSTRVDESTFEELELSLLKIYKDRNATQKQERVFSFNGFLEKTHKEADSLNEWVKKHL